MELFCTEAERNRLKTKEKRALLARRILLIAGAAGFIGLCLGIRTENAGTMHLLLILWALAAGWGFIALSFRRQEAGVQRKHVEMLQNGEKQVREGVLSLEEDTIRIPQSIRIRKVRLDTGGAEPERLNLNERWVGLLPPEGSRVRLTTAGSYVAGAETLERAEGPARRPQRGRDVLRRAVPLLGIWALAAVFLSSFVFFRIRDTDPAHKITVYMDGEVTGGEALAARMEKALGGAVRMVEIRPFSYFMFGGEQLRTGDLYILPDSALEQFGEWILAESSGRVLRDPETGTAVAAETFRYGEEPPEIYRLYLGAASPHLEDGLAEKAAEILTETDKEESE